MAKLKKNLQGFGNLLYLSKSAELLAIGASNWQHQLLIGWYTDN